MNNDLISREALVKWIDDSVSQYGHTYSTDMLNMWGLFKDYLINNAPTVFSCNACKNMGNERECTDCHDYSNYVHYEEKPQGEWLIKNKGTTHYHYCSICNWPGDFFDPYCRHCGVRMHYESES